MNYYLKAEEKQGTRVKSGLWHQLLYYYCCDLFEALSFIYKMKPEPSELLVSKGLSDPNDSTLYISLKNCNKHVNARYYYFSNK